MPKAESTGEADLATDTPRPNGRRELRTHDFDRDFPFVFPLFGEIDGRHAAMSELALDRVTLIESAEVRCRSRHTEKYARLRDGAARESPSAAFNVRSCDGVGSSLRSEGLELNEQLV